ncbi:MAG: signal recognition particle receptor subunit alpha [Mycoplasmoidaceae bacterium]|nr:signal recognition particle receptor subunit alpha [Mycoplasmoidaceae bacterium]
MGFLDKFKNALKLKKKNKVAEQIKQKQAEASVIEQKKFDEGLKKSSSFINSSLNGIAKEYVRVDEQLIEKIESFLIQFDISYASVQKIVDSIVEEIKYQNVTDPNLIKEIIVDKLFIYYIQDTDIQNEVNLTPNTTNVILVTGVNGVGKTTSIAKLANKFKNLNLKVGLVAGDTFRAGAVEQLSV